MARHRTAWSTECSCKRSSEGVTRYGRRRLPGAVTLLDDESMPKTVIYEVDRVGRTRSRGSRKFR